jgi:hypothetical protein
MESELMSEYIFLVKIMAKTLNYLLIISNKKAYDSYYLKKVKDLKEDYNRETKIS